MNPNELRDLAQKIEEKWWRWKDNPTIELKAAAYLRACADALRIPEPMTDQDILDEIEYNRDPMNAYRAFEVAVLRQVKEVNE